MGRTRPRQYRHRVPQAMGLGMLIFAAIAIGGAMAIAVAVAPLRPAGTIAVAFTAPPHAGTPETPMAAAPLAARPPASFRPGSLAARPPASFGPGSLVTPPPDVEPTGLPRSVLHVSWRCPEYARGGQARSTLAHPYAVDSWGALGVWPAATAHYPGLNGAPWIGFTIDDICAGVPWGSFAGDFDGPGPVGISRLPLHPDQKNGIPQTVLASAPEPEVPWSGYARDFDDPGRAMMDGEPHIPHDQKTVGPRPITTSVPEPGAYALMLTSLGLVGLATHRRIRVRRWQGVAEPR